MPWAIHCDKLIWLGLRLGSLNWLVVLNYNMSSATTYRAKQMSVTATQRYILCYVRHRTYDVVADLLQSITSARL